MKQARLVCFVGAHFRRDAAAEQDNRAVAGELDFRKFRREQKDGSALAGDLSQQRIDLLLGADVDAARRIETEQRSESRTRASARSRPSAGCRPRACAIRPRRAYRSADAAPRHRRGGVPRPSGSGPNLSCRRTSPGRRSRGSIFAATGPEAGWRAPGPARPGWRRPDGGRAADCPSPALRRRSSRRTPAMQSKSSSCPWPSSAPRRALLRARHGRKPRAAHDRRRDRALPARRRRPRPMAAVRVADMMRGGGFGHLLAEHHVDDGRLGAFRLGSRRP